MALSSYDTLAVDQDGNPTTGVFTSPSGIQIEVRKTRINILDSKGWTKHMGFTEPFVSEIESGSVLYKDVVIEAIRGPQDGIYAVVYSYEYIHEKVSLIRKLNRRFHKLFDPYKIPWIIRQHLSQIIIDAMHNFSKKIPLPKHIGTKTNGMVCVGVYGYSGEDWVGILPSSMEWFQAKLRNHTKTKEILCIDNNGKLIEYESTEYEWEGIPDSLREISFEKAVRFNQGDKYFADRGVGEINTTKPGDADTPTMEKIVDGIKNDRNESKR